MSELMTAALPEKSLEWLNYHHLYYFWMVAREGSVVAAGRRLRLAHSTLTIQIRQLENRFKDKLLERSGRSLRLTELGRTVLEYAEEIFGLGNELLDVVHGRAGANPGRLVVGVANVMPKMLVRRLLLPVEQLPQPVSLICREHGPAELASMLMAHELDVVLNDSPFSQAAGKRTFAHFLGRCGVSFFATRELAAKCRRGFPASMDGMPMLLPCAGTTLRSSLERWFYARGIVPKVRAEFEDSALMKAFGQGGAGIFPAPSAVEDDVRRQHDVTVIGRTREIEEHFYALSIERRVTHPAIAAICSAARVEVFLEP